MLETSARLLRLLSLLQSRREWSGGELAARLGVTDRTVRRDVEKLRSLGYPVDSVSGVAGGYRLGAGAALPPLLLEDDEAVAVVVGLRTASGGMVAGIEETAVRALAKLEQVLPARLRHRVRAVQSATVAVPGRGPTVDADTLVALADACRGSLRLRFDYRDHDGGESLRVVEPHKLVHAGRRWYLVAFDVDRDAWRTFRVDRVRPRPPAGPRFAPREPPQEDIGAYTAYGVSTGVYPCRAVLRLPMSVEEATERVWPGAGVLEAVDEGACLLRLGARSWEDMAVWVWLLGVDFVVVEPAELLDRFRELAARITRVCEGSARSGDLR